MIGLWWIVAHGYQRKWVSKRILGIQNRSEISELMDTFPNITAKFLNYGFGSIQISREPNNPLWSGKTTHGHELVAKYPFAVRDTRDRAPRVNMQRSRCPTEKLLIEPDGVRYALCIQFKSNRPARPDYALRHDVLGMLR